MTNEDLLPGIVAVNALMLTAAGLGYMVAA